jgi:hypothetical protein
MERFELPFFLHVCTETIMYICDYHVKAESWFLCRNILANYCCSNKMNFSAR